MNISPCPFCGDDDPIHDEISPDVYAVICGTCGTIGPSYHGEAGGVSAELEDLLPNTTLEQAIEAWNSRASADMQAMRRWVRELEDTAKQLRAEIVVDEQRVADLMGDVQRQGLEIERLRGLLRLPQEIVQEVDPLPGTSCLALVPIGWWRRVREALSDD